MAHTIVSLPFGIYISNPLLIFLLAFIMHLLTDAVFHWNFDPRDHRLSTYALIVGEVLAGVILARVLVGPAFWSIRIWAAIAGGNAPDVLHMIWYLFTPERRERWPRWIKSYFWIHEKIQFETPNVLAGLIPQAILVGLAILLIKR